MAQNPTNAKRSAEESADSAMQVFQRHREEQAHRVKIRQEQAARVARRKAEVLLPLREFLRKVVDADVVVRNTNWTPSQHADLDAGMKALPPWLQQYPPMRFGVYEGDSSPHWGPGTSLFFDHPAKIEIAVPNHLAAEVEGAIVIHCASHRDQKLLHGPFENVDAALLALAEFLARNVMH